jgi:acyl-CoA thioesterase
LYTFLEQNHKDGNKFPDHIIQIISDGTCISFMNVESKELSQQWMHTHSPNKSKKFTQMLSGRQLMAAVFWDRKGVLVVELMQQGTTIMPQVYCKTLKELHRAIQKKAWNADIQCSAPQ